MAERKTKQVRDQQVNISLSKIEKKGLEWATEELNRRHGNKNSLIDLLRIAPNVVLALESEGKKATKRIAELEQLVAIKDALLGELRESFDRVQANAAESIALARELMADAKARGEAMALRDSEITELQAAVRQLSTMVKSPK